MVMQRINPPPRLSTPREAPWTEAEEVLARLDLINTNIRELIAAINSLSPGAPGVIPPPPISISFPTFPALLASGVDDVGISTGGTENTLNDSIKYWQANVWQGAFLLMSISGQLYVTSILSNTDQQLTFLPLPSGVKPIAGTPYVIKNLGLSAFALQAMINAMVTKTATQVIDLASIAALATSTLAQCTAIDLLVGPSGLALTIGCTFHALAVLGIRVHVRTSYDGVLYDTQDFDSWIPTFVAGAPIRVTKTYDVSPAYLKVLIENLDAARPVTAVGAWATIRG